MSWSPKVILAANFYGSYLKPSLFDDVVIIQDGTIEQLVIAVQPRLDTIARLSNGEADIYVFCLVGLTDLVNKSIVGDKYVLKPIENVLPELEIKMQKAARVLDRFGAKAIWSTTFPMSLAKYHISQGWNIDNMQQFGFSQGMDYEQQRLFRMTERFMDLCHTLNRRSSVRDLFFINKVYYSHSGHRELLTHNLLEDGINPTQSITDDWNADLTKYVQHIRRSHPSAASSLEHSSFEPSRLGAPPGDTLFTIARGMTQFGEKRPGVEHEEPYPKQARLENPLMRRNERQLAKVQQDLTMDVVKSITNKLDVSLKRSGPFPEGAAVHRQNDVGGPSSGQFEQYPQPRRVPGNHVGGRLPLSSSVPGVHASSLVEPIVGRRKRRRLGKLLKKTLVCQTSANANNSPMDHPKASNVNSEGFGLANEAGQAIGSTFPHPAVDDHHLRHTDSTSKPRLPEDFLPSRPAGEAPSKRALLGEPVDLRANRYNGPAPPAFVPRGPNFAGSRREMIHPEMAPQNFKAGDVLLHSKGIPNLIKSIIVGDEKPFPAECTLERRNYIMMVTKASVYTTNFCRVFADYDDQPGDKLGLLKCGSQRFAGFSKKEDFGDRSIIPAVSFLVTNQCMPGHERGKAPMTVLQKQVATYNTALYNLMRTRQKLVNKIKKKNDASISMPTKTYVPATSMLRRLQKQSKHVGDEGESEDSPETVNIADDSAVVNGTEQKSSFEKISEDEPQEESVSKVDDDWTDLEECDLEIDEIAAHNDTAETIEVQNACSASDSVVQVEDKSVEAPCNDSEVINLDIEEEPVECVETSKEDSFVESEIDGSGLPTQTSPLKSEICADEFPADVTQPIPSSGSVKQTSPSLANLDVGSSQESSTSEVEHVTSVDAAKLESIPSEATGGESEDPPLISLVSDSPTNVPTDSKDSPPNPQVSDPPTKVPIEVVVLTEDQDGDGGDLPPESGLEGTSDVQEANKVD